MARKKKNDTNPHSSHATNSTKRTLCSTAAEEKSLRGLLQKNLVPQCRRKPQVRPMRSPPCCLPEAAVAVGITPTAMVAATTNNKVSSSSGSHDSPPPTSSASKRAAYCQQDSPRSGSRSPTSSTGSTTDPQNPPERRTKFTKVSLSETGKLRVRLRLLDANNNFMHWPIPAPPKTCCQLHRWIAGIDRKADVAICKCCSVALCTQCYELFHTEKNIPQKKELYKEQYLRDWKSSHPHFHKALGSKRKFNNST